MPSNLETSVAVVTGASSGIGKEAARALAARGWRVIGVGRDPERTGAAEADLRAAGDVAMIRADLASLREARRAADGIAARVERIDVLLNNAGGVTADRVVTAEGNEGTFAGNHLGPFLLTNRLLPLLRAAAASAPAGRVRIVNTSSSGHEQAPGFDWDDLQMLQGFISGRAYCNAKLANVLHARALARRLADDRIVAHAMHPGVVHSNFVSHADEGMQRYMQTLEGMTPEEGADTLVWLATADEPGRSTGGYFHKRQAVPMSPAAQDDALAERLWAASETLVSAYAD
ncbi:SDR family NAD(P)-dependent oxidoreductase [Phenylobacterium sp. LjRoot219]|uniref:SDR family NAD(P)-dependent oxidoreductase n=1 Tax=Phenylobacterium sp. LjRoot219 TaxID=3342283 RepID=UPI003ECE2E31